MTVSESCWMLLGLLSAAFLLNQDRECEEQRGYFYVRGAKEWYKNSVLNLVCVALLLKRLLDFFAFSLLFSWVTKWCGAQGTDSWWFSDVGDLTWRICVGVIQPHGDVLYTLVIHRAKIDSNPLMWDCQVSNNRAQVSAISSKIFFINIIIINIS